jgi:predicted AAA+ superfamily ATPase
MFERSELQILKKRINEPRKLIQVISGPRQVGKTTLITQLYDQLSIPAVYESADAVPAGNNVWLDQVWDTARLRMRSQKANEFLVIIDEIQKIPNWSETVKKNWDYDSFNKTNLKIVLLGSSTSRLLLQQELTESLAGRFENIILPHWSFEEINKAFGWDADTFAWFGGYPGSAELITDESRWKRYIRDSIIETSISKDILMLTLVQKPALLKNLFELGCLYSGQILSYTKMLGQLQDAGNTTTLSHYLKLLGAAGLIGGIEKYSSSSLRIRAGSPKLQVYNNALLSSQSQKNFTNIKNTPEEWRRVIESTVGAYLANESLRGSFNLYYWRDRNDEVDFVIERDGKIIGVEAKSTLLRNKRGLSAFQKKFNPIKMVCIDNRTMPWQEFIRINPVDFF